MNEIARHEEERKVSVALIAGIVVMPYIFAWFTLKKGYSVLARGLSLGWLAASVAIIAFAPEAPKKTEAPNTEPREKITGAQDERKAFANSSDASTVETAENGPVSDTEEVELFKTDESDEVGSKFAVVNPARYPLMSHGDKDYWNCSGLLNHKIVVNMYRAIVKFSDDSEMSPPQPNTCFFERQVMELMGQRVTFYSAEFFISDESAQEAENPERILRNWRSATFYPRKDGVINATLFMTDERGQNMKTRCVNMFGNTLIEDNCLKLAK